MFYLWLAVSPSLKGVRWKLEAETMEEHRLLTGPQFILAELSNAAQGHLLRIRCHPKWAEPSHIQSQDSPPTDESRQSFN